MRRKVLDTTILIAHWRRRRSGRPLAQIDEAEVEIWARQLIKIEQSDATVTPVLLEFLCGIGDRQEMMLARAFLKQFKAIDDSRTLKQDWQRAQRLAERVPASRRPRDLGPAVPIDEGGASLLPVHHDGLRTF